MLGLRTRLMNSLRPAWLGVRVEARVGVRAGVRLGLGLGLGAGLGSGPGLGPRARVATSSLKITKAWPVLLSGACL
eukprot:scaffold24780_cov19-Phaeocystis_antarctica.AAC.1